MPFASLFWLIALLLVAGTVAALVWPLLRGRSSPSPEDDSAATNVYRDQKRQLDDELAAGAMTRAERDAQLDELSARLGAELAAASPPAPRTSPRSSYIAALILVAVIPASALLLYASFGNPGSLRTATRASEAPSMSQEQIVAMVDKLATRMKEHPEDPVGWRLLARAYASMGRFGEAVAAFSEAAARAPADAPLLADWADALAMQNRSLQGEPSKLVARALALDPRYPKALALAATAALERKDYSGAIGEWRKLKMEFPPGGEETKQIDAMIAEAEAARSGAPKAASVDASAITGRVSLAPKLRDRVGAQDTLFIFARAVDGPRMPLAVVRTTASDLPRDFRLDDSMAMTPTARLSAAGQVIVEARVSKSGSATPAPGDLRGTSAAVTPGAHDVSIAIDDIVR
ncbi:MAG TPA: c-type cytochrome biogenesis protein CcmI [Casimicrobiaceae bacterium]|nr:c-type cytochrome biogenesis protein CcmI [Casimicrobiaceae bacterium]